MSIDWAEVATLVLASLLISLCSGLFVLYKQVTRVLRYAETAAPHLAEFAKHIVDCEARAVAVAERQEARAIALAEHQARNKEHREETNLRLRTLEQALMLGRKVNALGELA